MTHDPNAAPAAKAGAAPVQIEGQAGGEPHGARDQRARREAAAWYAKMTGQRVSNQEVAAFFAWRGESLNDAAYTRIEQMTTRARALADDPRLQAIAQAAALRPREGRLRAAL